MAKKHGYKKNDLRNLFNKIEDDQIQMELDKLQAQLNDTSGDSNSTEEVDFPELKDLINFDDFVSMDLRIGIIEEVSEVPKSNKLLAFKVNIGVETRTILSGIKKHVSMDKLIGQKVTVICNLAPRAIMGMESEGMILMAESPDGRLHFVTSEASQGSILS